MRILIFVLITTVFVRIMNKSTDHIGSLAKGLRVLECFSADHPRLSITDVASATGLDRATARRCLLTLHHEGFANYDGKFFTLTTRSLRLGMGALSALPLPHIVQPWLDQLAEQIGHSCSVCVLDDHEIVYLARAAQRRVMSIGLMPGSRLPAHCTSMGRILLAALTKPEARAVIDRSDLTPRTAFSLTEPDDIMAAITQAEVDGYCINDQEIEIGLRSLAVPVYNAAGQVMAALNTGMAATQSNAAELADAYLPALLKVQSGLRRLL